jgi:hypothetical protein
VWDKNVRAIQFYNRLGFKRSQEKVKPVTGLGGVILNQIRLTKGD